MYAVVIRETRQEISYHDTTAKCLIAICNYEHLDKMDGTYERNKYDWDFARPE